MTTQISGKSRIIAEEKLAEIIKENEQLKKQLKKQNGTPLKLAGRFFRSKFHDYEAYGSWYATKDKELIKGENGMYVFDDGMNKVYFNTQAMRDFIDGKTNSCPFYLEEE